MKIHQVLIRFFSFSSPRKYFNSKLIYYYAFKARFKNFKFYIVKKEWKKNKTEYDIIFKNKIKKYDFIKVDTEIFQGISSYYIFLPSIGRGNFYNFPCNFSRDTFQYRRRISHIKY